MTITPTYRIKAFISDKESFSIPMIQSELGLDYGEIREIISDLIDEEKVAFLGGILYKWTSIEEKNNDSRLRGSSNQEIHILNPEFAAKYQEYLDGGHNQIQNFTTSDGIVSVGIHRKGFSLRG